MASLAVATLAVATLSDLLSAAECLAVISVVVAPRVSAAAVVALEFFVVVPVPSPIHEYRKWTL